MHLLSLACYIFLGISAKDTYCLPFACSFISLYNVSVVLNHLLCLLSLQKPYQCARKLLSPYLGLSSVIRDIFLSDKFSILLGDAPMKIPVTRTDTLYTSAILSHLPLGFCSPTVLPLGSHLKSHSFCFQLSPEVSSPAASPSLP